VEPFRCQLFLRRFYLLISKFINIQNIKIGGKLNMPKAFFVELKDFFACTFMSEQRILQRITL